MHNKFYFAFIAIFVFFIIPFNMEAGTLIDFNDLPATGSKEVPGSSDSWIYTTQETNPSSEYKMTQYDRAGWRKSESYINDNVNNYFYIYLNTHNNYHMGWETYGYLEISDSNTISGNSLKYVVTGGKNGETGEDSSSGERVTTKEQYLDYLNNGIDPVGSDSLAIGNPYLYFSNTGGKNNPVAFEEAQVTNRLSFYVYLPENVSNGDGGWQTPPHHTLTVGPYTDKGGHWYHKTYTEGGGWTHVLIDGHPVHNNSWHNASKYPYPSKSLRNMED